MNVILAIETSTEAGSVAVWRGGAVSAEWSFASERQHNSLIFGPLGDALAIGTPDLIVVGTGPGSYSGVRVGIAAAVGIGLARGIPVIGWPSITAIDGPDRFRVVGDARRGSFFVADVSAGQLADAPRLVDFATLVALAGDGMPTFTVDREPPFPQAIRATPASGRLARRGASLDPDRVASLSATTPEPLYLRAPFITTPKSRFADRERSALRRGGDFG